MPDTNLSNQPPHSSPSPPQRFHGVLPIRGLEDVPRSALYEGRFGRMFRNLPPFAPDDADLLALAALMRIPPLVSAPLRIIPSVHQFPRCRAHERRL